jgi:integrase
MSKKHASKKGRVVGRMKPLLPQQVSTIEQLLAQDDDWRGLALFRLAIDTMFRASDLVEVQTTDITGMNGEILEEISIRQRKTGGVVKSVMSSPTREALRRWMAVRPQFVGTFLFPGRHVGDHLSDSQYRREAKKWFRAARLDTRFYSTHSLRRTKAALVYAKTGNVEVVRQLLGHSSVQATSRYLGVEEADALRVAREIRI